MSLQGVIVAVLVVLATLYVFRRLAPRRWLRWLGIGRRGRGSGPSGAGTGGAGGECGCGDCPAAPKPHRRGG